MQQVDLQRHSEVVIRTQRLSRSFYPQKFSTLFRPKSSREFVAVDGVDLNVNAGEIFGLVGPNGAGKTTLIKMLCTMLKPTSGKATVGGFDVVKHDFQVRKLVGLVTSNERSFYWRLSGRQNMRFFAQLYKIPPAEADAWIDELFRFLELKPFEDKRFDGYSTGIKQRMAIARGLLSKPKIIFMDEPTKGVDPISSSEIISIIKDKLVDLWHPTLLITSHNLREIERLCNRVAIINQGRIQAVGTFEELRAQARVHEVYTLEVRRLAPERLENVLERYPAVRLSQVVTGREVTELKIEFHQGSEVFNDVVYAIIGEGGKILKCTAVENSFEDVFSEIVLNGSTRS